MRGGDERRRLLEDRIETGLRAIEETLGAGPFELCGNERCEIGQSREVLV